MKGHAGCQWNDAADCIAKNSIELALEDSNRILDSKYLCSFSFPLQFIPTWSDIIIDRNIRSFTKEVSNSLEDVKWSFNKYWANYFNEAQSQIGVHWNTYWSHINSISKHNCTSFHTNDLFIHFIKCTNILLPTVDNLRKRNNVYEGFLCPLCNEVDESLTHLLICKETEQSFATIEQDVTEKS